MRRSALSPCAALGIALALTVSVPSNSLRDSEDPIQLGTEVSSPSEQPRGDKGALDMAPPPDPVLPDDGTKKDEGPFNPD